MNQIARWKIRVLGDVCDVIGGGTPSKKNDAFYQGNIPWATVRDMKNDVITKTDFSITEDAVINSSTNIIKANNVVIATRVGLGKVCIINQDTAINQDLRGIVPKNNSNLDVRFLFWWLKSVSRIIEGEGTGATVQGVKLPFVKSLQIPLPSLEEQKRIVAILDEAFAGIDAAIANTEKNLANARELFESYLDSVFTKQGEGWVEKKLSEVCGIVSSLIDPRMEDFIDLPHIGAGNIISKTGELIDIQTAREEGLKSGKFLFDEKMVLYSKIRPYLEKVARPDFHGLCSADMYPLMPKEGLLDRDFLYYLLLSRQFTDYAIAGSARAGMPKVNRSHLFQYTTAFPEIAIQEKLSEQLNAIEVESKRLDLIYQQKLTSLLELKQSLLQKAFSGVLTAEADKLMDEAVA